MRKYPGSLHGHSEFSNLRLRDAITRSKDMIEYSVELGHEVIAFTEHEALCNAVKIEKEYKAIKKEHPNFKVILGNEIYLVDKRVSATSFRFPPCPYVGKATSVHKIVSRCYGRVYDNSTFVRRLLSDTSFELRA